MTAMLIWGISFVWVNTLLKVLDPFTIVFFRLIIASVCFVTFSLAIKKLQLIKKEDIPTFLLLAFLEPFIYYIGESYGIKFSSPTIASLLISTIPLFVPIALYFLAKEKIALNNLWGIIIAFFGVALVLINKNYSFDTSMIGVAFLMMAIGSATFYSYLLHKLVKKYNPITIITSQNFIGIFFFAPLFFIFDFQSFNPSVFTTEIIYTLCALAVLASSIAFMLFTMGVQKLGVTKATVFTYTIPVFTAFFSFLYDGEEFSILKIIGIIVLVTGLMLSQIKKTNFISVGKKT
jgi:drug/metabolite transporter (DMT)-like permease